MSDLDALKNALGPGFTIGISPDGDYIISAGLTLCIKPPLTDEKIAELRSRFADFYSDNHGPWMPAEGDALVRERGNTHSHGRSSS